MIDGAKDCHSSFVSRMTDPIGDILRSAKTIAVVGLSSKRFRPSYGVSQYLQASGDKIIPVNPHEAEVLSERAYPDLESIPKEPRLISSISSGDRKRYPK